MRARQEGAILEVTGKDGEAGEDLLMSIHGKITRGCMREKRRRADHIPKSYPYLHVYPHLYSYPRNVTNLARQAPWRQRWCQSHPCRPVARPWFRCHSRGHPLRLGTSTNLCHIAPVAISPTAGQSRPLSFVSVLLLACPSPVIVTYVISCWLCLRILSPVHYICCLPLMKLTRPVPGSLHLLLARPFSCPLRLLFLID